MEHFGSVRLERNFRVRGILLVLLCLQTLDRLADNFGMFEQIIPYPLFELGLCHLGRDGRA